MMFYERKTKDRSPLYYLAFPATVLGIFFGVGTLAGFPIAFYVLGGMFGLISVIPFVTYWRTQNAGYLVVALFQVFTCLALVSAASMIEDKSKLGLTPVFLVIMYALMMASAYMAFNRKLRWRGQDIFELAAMPIEDLGNNFTARPRPTGQTDVSKTEMIRFIDFATRNLLAFVFREENRVVFVLALPGNDLPYLFGLRSDYLDDTWVAIDYDGNVSVNITEEDYLLFKQDLNFDQLCQSLGDVFVEFLELSRQGKESLIIDRMNALRLSPLN